MLNANPTETSGKVPNAAFAGSRIWRGGNGR